MLKTTDRFYGKSYQKYLVLDMILQKEKKKLPYYGLKG